MLEAFIKMLYEYRNQMGLLIGEYSLEKLCQYIYGAGDAFAMCGYDDVQKAFSSPWWDYVDVYYGMEPGTGVRGWFRIIREHCGSDQEAVSVFYELLSGYLRRYYPEITVPDGSV